MYIIKSGEVEVLVDDHGGEQPLRKIDHLYRGRCFGERALVKKEPRMAHIRALGALECFSITKDILCVCVCVSRRGWWEGLFDTVLAW